RQAGVSACDDRLITLQKSDGFALLAAKLCLAFDNVLVKNGVADFSSLVASALKAREHLLWQNKVEHVLVDEVQDANQQELTLVANIAGTSCRTWVGDPNQSLYGWRGSAGCVPKTLSVCFLRNNYRSSARIIACVNAFLSASTIKTDVPFTKIQAHRQEGCLPTLITYPRYGEDQLCLRLVNELLGQDFGEQDILILSRAHEPLKQLHQTHARYTKVRLATVHAVKGLEAPVVIIIGAAAGRFGFPAEQHGRGLAVLNTLAGYDQTREEHNIFYVALTRARDRLVIAVPQQQKSPFTQELSRRIVRRVTVQ
ncbi:MAG: 3'-5' exonuclease, partial [Parcubacteria group bacterium]